MSDFRSLFSEAVHAVQHDNEYRGTVGLLDPATGVVSFAVTGYPQHIWVMIQQGNAMTPRHVLNRDCPHLYGLPVIIRLNADGNPEAWIDSYRAMAFLGSNGPPLGVAYHSHRWGTGLEDVVEAERFQPGLVHTKSGLTVTIEGFYYDNGKGVQVYFPTTDVDLTSYRPTTAGYFGWAKIGYVQATGAVVVVKSTEKTLKSDLTSTLLGSTQLTGGARAIAGVIVQQGQTSISNQGDIAACHERSHNPAIPTRAFMMHEDALAIAGSAISTTHDAAQNYGWVALQGSSNGDAFTQSFLLRAGTYTFRVLGMTDFASGKIDWSVDGTAIVSGQDWYSAGITYNVRKSNASIAIPTSGYHVLTGTVNGKNGSSASYSMNLTRYGFVPASD